MKVWHVLAGLGGLVVLLTPKKVMAMGFTGGNAVELELAPIGGGLFLSAAAARDFLEMQAAAKAEGVRVVPDGPRAAFRTLEQQQEMVKERPEYAAPAGYSNHQMGEAVDVDTEGGTNVAFAWLTSNAARFNFRRTVAREPWHWEHR